MRTNRILIFLAALPAGCAQPPQVNEVAGKGCGRNPFQEERVKAKYHTECGNVPYGVGYPRSEAASSRYHVGEMGYCSTYQGLRKLAPWRISKCRCAPVELPVEPQAPMAAPLTTVWPQVTYQVLRWA